MTIPLEMATWARQSDGIFADLWRNHDSLLRLDFGISFLDDGTLGLFPKETTLMGSRSGGGKTELATQVLIQQVAKAKSVLYFALDHEQGEIENRILWRMLVEHIRETRAPQFHGVPLRYAQWRAGNYAEMTKPFEADYRLRWKHTVSTDQARFFYARGGMTAKEIAAIIASPTLGPLYNLVIIDHFHAMNFDGKNLFESQKQAMKLLVQAAEYAERPLLIMGQFRKRSPNNKSPIPDMEEFSGSSDLIYLPNNIIVFAPKFGGDTDKWETYFHIVKSRIASDSKAYVGVHSFDQSAKTYSQKYVTMKFRPYDEPEELQPNEVPKWAHRAHSFIPSERKKDDETWWSK